MFNFFKKKQPENIFDKVVKSVLTDNSPLERWLSGLKKENRTELYIFHLIYGWLFIIDHNLINDADSDKDENSVKYLTSFYSLLNIKINKSKSSQYKILTNKEFLEIFLDRFLKHRTELTFVRKYQLNTTPYFPNYFYSRIMIHPLEIRGTRIIN